MYIPLIFIVISLISVAVDYRDKMKRDRDD